MRINRTIGRKAARNTKLLALAVSAAMVPTVCAGGSPIPTDHFDPLAYTSLGNVNLSNGVLNINTDTGQMTGALTLTGTYVGQGTGGPNVLMFDFSNFQLGSAVTVNITGSAPLAILSRTNMNIATAFNLDGGSGDTAGNGGIARGGIGTGGVGGTSGANGGNVGHGSGLGSPHDGGGGAYGGNGGAGDTSSFGGVSYGDLSLGLQSGSGGAGAAASDGSGGGGGAGGGAIELTAVGTLSVATLSANGGLGGNSSFDGGAGSGGGIRLYANLINQNGTIFAKGGNGTEFGGAGGGGRMQFSFGTVSASQVSSGFAVSAVGGVSGGLGGAQAGAAGVIVETVKSFTEDTPNLFGFGQSSGPSGNVTVSIGTLNLPVGGGQNISPYTWTSGGGVNLNGGSLNVTYDMTFAAGSNFNWSSGTLGILSGKTLAFDGGTGTVTAGGKGLPNNTTLKVTNSGKFTSNSYFDIGSSADAGNGPTGTLLVSAGGTYQQTAGLNPFWGDVPGDYANVTFTGSNSVGSLGSGLGIAVAGGSADVNINSGARLQVDNALTVGIPTLPATPNGVASGRQSNNQTAGSIGGFANITIDTGGTLTATGPSYFGIGANVNLIDGGLNLSDATFSSGSNLNWTGGVLGDNSKITFDGGVGSFSGAHGLPSGATLAIINGGSVTTNDYLDIGSSIDAGNGPTGTLLVSGAGSRIDVHNNSTSAAWGGVNGDSATVTFSAGGAGSIDNLDMGFVGGRSLVTINGGSTLTIGNQLSMGGLATSAATLNVAGGAMSTGTVAKLATGAVVNYSAGSFNAGNMTMASNAKINLTTGGDKVLRTGGLVMTGTSKIDLADNDMIVGSLSTSRSTIEGYARSGRNGGSWNGTTGLLSSSALFNANHNTTLGVMSGADFHSVQGASALFDGLNVNDSDVLVKYTYYGDINFNGTVDGGDYARIDFAFGQEGSLGNLGGWINGDFNYDGKVDGSDYANIDFAFSSQNGVLARALAYLGGTDTDPGTMNDPALKLIEQHLAEFGEPYRADFIVDVPEPVSITGVVASAAMCALLKRRRRAQ